VTVRIVVGERLAVAEGGLQGAAGIGDPSATEGPGRLVEPPLATGAIVGLVGQEVQLCFQGV